MAKKKKKENKAAAKAKGKSTKVKKEKPIEAPTRRAVPKRRNIPKDDGSGLRYIVRIAGKDLDGSRTITNALTKIKGIGQRMAQVIAVKFAEKHNVDITSKLGLLDEAKDKDLEELVLNPKENGIPAYSLNKRKEYNTGEDKHLIMADLAFDLRQMKQRELKTKSYVGLRHAWSLPVRGQRNKSTHRKGAAIGVVKKKK